MISRRIYRLSIYGGHSITLPYRKKALQYDTMAVTVSTTVRFCDSSVSYCIESSDTSDFGSVINRKKIVSISDKNDLFLAGRGCRSAVPWPPVRMVLRRIIRRERSEEEKMRAPLAVT